MLRSLRPVLLLFAAVALVGAPAASAAKSKKVRVSYPSVSKVSPKKAGIGDTMTITGKGFRSGKNKNVVVLKRDGGRAVFVKAAKATKTKITFTLPAKLLPFLVRKADQPRFTRFRVRVLAGRLGKRYTSVKASPLIGPSAVAIGSVDDCDGDKIPNSRDNDDDNDLLSDGEEARLGLQSCNRDTDGDGLSDGWEQQSAIDRNGGNVKPSPSRRTWNNALDPKDGTKTDSDGDGLSNLEEYMAWATFGGNKIPLSYSGGNPASAGRYKVSDELAYMDQDGNGFLSDFERDADGDLISNKDEVRNEYDMGGTRSSQDGSDTAFHDFGIFTQTYLDEAAEKQTQDKFYCAGVNQVPYYCADLVKPDAPKIEKVDTLDWLDADTDGDTLRDDQDDVDHDDIPNITEYLTELALPKKDRRFGPLNACVPNSDSRFCLLGTVDVDKDGLDNAADTDDDGDGLDDALEQQIGTDRLIADTDRDGVSDAFEYHSAKDFNTANLPYPGKRPYPNALFGSDADLDFDQDGLTQRAEYKAWLYTGGRLPLTYSDGSQATGGGTPDDERDVDSDGLSNFDEFAGSLSSASWWDAWILEDANKCSDAYKESAYPGPAYLGLDFVDPDTDGDGVKDGADDIDHDGFTNAFEATRAAGWCTTYATSGGRYGRVQPFNPCKPIYSAACHKHPPFGYYKDGEDWASPYTS